MENHTGSLFFPGLLIFILWVLLSPERKRSVYCWWRLCWRGTRPPLFWDKTLISFLQLINWAPQTCWLPARQTRVGLGTVSVGSRSHSFGDEDFPSRSKNSVPTSLAAQRLYLALPWYRQHLPTPLHVPAKMNGVITSLLCLVFYHIQT